MVTRVVFARIAIRAIRAKTMPAMSARQVRRAQTSAITFYKISPRQSRGLIFKTGADNGSRTRLACLGSTSSTDELYPRYYYILPRQSQNVK